MENTIKKFNMVYILTSIEAMLVIYAVWTTLTMGEIFVTLAIGILLGSVIGNYFKTDSLLKIMRFNITIKLLYGLMLLVSISCDSTTSLIFVLILSYAGNTGAYLQLLKIHMNNDTNVIDWLIALTIAGLISLVIPALAYFNIVNIEFSDLIVSAAILNGYLILSQDKLKYDIENIDNHDDAMKRG